ncbi:MAG: GNAT family N-acetyltransferase [Bacteroidota bacterium]
MTTIKTLEGISQEDILTVFNHSFSDYIVRIELSREQLSAKMRAEQVDLSISVGAFMEGKLVGFILHGSRMLEGQKTFYNGGTGVIPPARGRQLTTKMYQFILPLLQTKGYERGVLEVITSNEPALKSYQRTGFTIKRSLPCYRGEVMVNAEELDLSFAELAPGDLQDISSFFAWSPTWQNHTQTLQRMLADLQLMGAFHAGQLIGAVVYDPQSLRVKQFGVHPDYRQKGFGTALFHHCFQGANVAITNVDGDSMASQTFLEKLGLAEFLRQYEMEILL